MVTIRVPTKAVPWHGEVPASKKWFYEDVLGGELVLHSNEIGDELGIVKVLSIDIEPHNHRMQRTPKAAPLS